MSALFRPLRRSGPPAVSRNASKSATMRSAGLVLLLLLQLHAAAALLALRLAPPPAHRPAEARPAVVRAAATVRMAEEAAEALLVADKWTEAGFEGIQGIMGVCKRLGQKRAESEHLAISLLRDERTMASRVVAKAGVEPKALLAGFEAYAAANPQQRGAQDDEPPSLGDSLAFLLRRSDAQRKTLTDEYLAPEPNPAPNPTPKPSPDASPRPDPRPGPKQVPRA